MVCCAAALTSQLLQPLLVQYPVPCVTAIIFALGQISLLNTFQKSGRTVSCNHFQSNWHMMSNTVGYSETGQAAGVHMCCCKVEMWKADSGRGQSGCRHILLEGLTCSQKRTSKSKPQRSVRKIRPGSVHPVG
jgi:hypothetical protein